jgi:hypothetical protein
MHHHATMVLSLREAHRKLPSLHSLSWPSNITTIFGWLIDWLMKSLYSYAQAGPGRDCQKDGAFHHHKDQSWRDVIHDMFVYQSGLGRVPRHQE